MFQLPEKDDAVTIAISSDPNEYDLEDVNFNYESDDDGDSESDEPKIILAGKKRSKKRKVCTTSIVRR